MAKNPCLFTPVISGNDIGSANERQKCGVEDVKVVFKLLFSSVSLNLWTEDKIMQLKTEVHYNILLIFVSTIKLTLIQLMLKITARLLHRSISRRRRFKIRSIPLLCVHLQPEFQGTVLELFRKISQTNTMHITNLLT